MREYLRLLKNEYFDGINFYINEDGNIEVSGFTYHNPGEKLEGSPIGDLYDIIIFSYERPKLPERFQAILTSPLDYISRMIDDGFLGVVAKATTTSEEFMQESHKALEKIVSDYIDIIEDEKNGRKA